MGHLAAVQCHQCSPPTQFGAPALQQGHLLHSQVGILAQQRELEGQRFSASCTRAAGPQASVTVTFHSLASSHSGQGASKLLGYRPGYCFEAQTQTALESVCKFKVVDRESCLQATQVLNSVQTALPRPLWPLDNGHYSQERLQKLVQALAMTDLSELRARLAQ